MQDLMQANHRISKTFTDMLKYNEKMGYKFSSGMKKQSKEYANLVSELEERYTREIEGICIEL